MQGRIQDLIKGGGGGPGRDRPKTAILGPQFCRILVLGPHFWWSGGGGARAPGAPPGSAPVMRYGIGFTYDNILFVFMMHPHEFKFLILPFVSN